MRRVLLGVALAATILAAGTIDNSARAGSATGAGTAVHTVQANTTDVFRRVYLSGELAIVRVVGDGDTDLDVFVYDEDGNLVAKDDDGTDNCVVAWTPTFTHRYTIRVVNLGGVYNRYRITTN